ncbi:GFA family protein [uncultured Shewanella sp.]|uniref:GFA family protein n=1 Tax=uncultured Shewanella sp. TaxID=173975 RepID=UPI0026129656|nr:GFA family protein [uncultured Shewanella sp.]
MTREYKGRCLCHSVEFTITGEFDCFFLCHCSRCQKGTGTAHGANLFATKAELTWLTGESHVRQFKVPDTLHQRAFCERCGAAMPNLQMDGKLLVVPAGSLDTPFDIKPNAHICCDDRAEWDTELHTLACVPGLPT